MKKKRYLIDETLFVYLDRENPEHLQALTAFLDDGSLVRANSKEGRAHELHMPKTSKYRLGGTWFNKLRISILAATAGKESSLYICRKKARIRLTTIKSYVRNFHKLTFFQKSIGFWELTNLYLDANQKKSDFIKSTELRPIKPNEIIPFEVCEIAMIAKNNKMILLSFNEDYRFLMKRSGGKIVCQYQNASDFLAKYRNN